MAKIFDHKTEAEDDKVDEIIKTISLKKSDMSGTYSKLLSKGKRKIDKEIKKRLKKKYLNLNCA